MIEEYIPFAKICEGVGGEVWREDVSWNNEAKITPNSRHAF